MRRLSFVAVLGCLIALAGCGGGGNTVTVPGTYAPPTTGGPFVYVTDGGFNVLQIAQSSNAPLSPSSAISGPNTGLQGAAGIARDTAGNIYVANNTVSQILVF